MTTKSTSHFMIFFGNPFFLISKRYIDKKRGHPSAQGVYKGKEIKYKNCKSLGNQ